MVDLKFKVSIIALMTAGLFSPTFAQGAGEFDKATAEPMHPGIPAYSPYASCRCPTPPFFAETHLQRRHSMDHGAKR